MKHEAKTIERVISRLEDLSHERLVIDSLFGAKRPSRLLTLHVRQEEALEAVLLIEEQIELEETRQRILHPPGRCG